jgi:predicted nucleic acid-binding protein
MGISVTGTVGILKASVMSGQISLTEADAHLNKMIKAGFYSPVRNISEIV